MLYYYKAMPLAKTAAAFSHFYPAGFLGRGLARMGRTFRNRALGIAGAAAGAAGGAWLGNKAYNNAIPPVKQLPGVEQLPNIPVWQPDQDWRRISEYADY